MKIKPLLCLLAIVPFIFFSCEDEKEGDYRDVYEGTYVTNMIGSMTLVDAEFSYPMEANADIVVRKSGNEELIFTIDKESMTVTVDNNGYFTVPSESNSQTQTDPETGIRITMNLTSTGFGTITSKTLYIKETLSGNAILEMIGEEDYYSEVLGTIVYNGTKK